jgi:hypothetical protein
MKKPIKKNNLAEHTMAIKIPKELLEKFKIKCDVNYKTMSNVLRDYIIEYVKD